MSGCTGAAAKEVAVTAVGRGDSDGGGCDGDGVGGGDRAGDGGDGWGAVAA